MVARPETSCQQGFPDLGDSVVSEHAPEQTIGPGLLSLFHGFVLGEDLSLTVDLPLLLFSLLSGLALGWIRIRAGSVLPVMAAHSGINLSGVLLA